MNASRRLVLESAVATVASAAWPLARAQAGYPNQPIKIVCTYPPGGIVDILARLLGDKLQRSLGQPVIVESRAGAGGNIGTAYVARTARGDAHTLLMGASGPLAANVTLFKNLGYDPLKDFTPITLVAATPLVLTVNASAKASSLSELIALLKSMKEKATYATAGVGTPQHLGVELFKQQVGVDSTHIPYKGAAPGVNALLAGEVTFSMDHLVLVMPHIRAGKLRPLAVTTAKRVSELPDVATLQELGVSNFEVRGWYGLLAPADVSDAIVRKLNAESVAALRQPDVVAQLATFGSSSVAGTPEEFRALIASEITKWRDVITKAKITAD
jgi:tripartite-type tricarboxylate transporter receptor subunit TctC